MNRAKLTQKAAWLETSHNKECYNYFKIGNALTCDRPVIICMIIGP